MTSIWDQLRVTVRLLRILANLSPSRSDLVYDVLSERHVMGDNSLFVNLGYWKRGAKSLDEAARDLAALLAEQAGFQAGDCVLDAGFGFADQDLQWVDAYDRLRILGVNVSPFQVRAARQRVEHAGQADRIDLLLGDAVATPFPSGTFDRVVALESAFHFRTRAAFFREAYRLLRHGGRIALADFVAAPPPRRPRGVPHQLARIAGLISWQIPPVNLVPISRYERQLQAVGFRNIRIESIGESVFEPFVAYQRQRFDTPEFRARYHPLIRFTARFLIDWGFLRSLDYVIATAEK